MIQIRFADIIKDKISIMKRIIVAIITILSVVQMNAQQDAMFTHYMYNTLGVNSGYAGSRDALTVTLLHRTQWLGFEGAPQTQTLTLHSPFKDNKMGLGLSVINDKIGPTKSTSIYGDFAYRLTVSEKATLAFGLKAGVNMYNSEINGLSTSENNDVAFQGDVTKTTPNFGFGVYYYTDKFYLGLSTPRLMETKLNSGEAIDKRHYFLIAGTVFDLTDDIKLKPTGFMKVTDGAPIEGDITGTLIFNDKFRLGAMFRTGDALGLLLGLDITDQLSFGYSFDWSYRSDWNNVEKTIQRTSHELMLRYDFIYKNEEKIRSPRYF